MGTTLLEGSGGGEGRAQRRQQQQQRVRFTPVALECFNDILICGCGCCGCRCCCCHGLGPLPGLGLEPGAHAVCSAIFHVKSKRENKTNLQIDPSVNKQMQNACGKGESCRALGIPFSIGVAMALPMQLSRLRTLRPGAPQLISIWRRRRFRMAMLMLLLMLMPMLPLIDAL